MKFLRLIAFTILLAAMGCSQEFVDGLRGESKPPATQPTNATTDHEAGQAIGAAVRTLPGGSEVLNLVLAGLAAWQTFEHIKDHKARKQENSQPK